MPVQGCASEALGRHCINLEPLCLCCTVLPGPATARLFQAAAPKRCNPQGFKPDGGKPLLYLYVWAGPCAILMTGIGELCSAFSLASNLAGLHLQLLTNVDVAIITRTAA